MTRHVTGPLESLSSGRWETTSSTGLVTYGAPFHYPSKYYHSEAVGEDTPNFRHNLRKGKLIPYTNWRQSQSEGYCTGTYDKRRTDAKNRSRIDGFAGYRNWYPSYSSIFPDLFVEAERFDLVQGAAANLYSKGFDALTFGAELGKTAKMFRDVGKSLTKFANLRADPLAVADLWLQGRYGWRPLIHDLKNLEDAVKKFDSNRQRYSARRSDVIFDSSSSNTDVDEGECVMTWSQNHTVTLSRRGSVVADIYPARFRTDIYGTAWELVPYSFVVDWMFDVGTAIEAASFLTLACDYTAANGYKMQFKSHESWAVKTWDSGYTGDISQSSYYEATFVSRKPVSVSSKPQIVNKLDSYKVVDSIALLLQRFKRR